MNGNRCSIPGCTEKSVGRKLCRKHYQRAWKAGEFVNKPLPPRVAARTVCPPEHKHAGSSTCFIMHQCRCTACMGANSEMRARRSKLKAYGRFDTGLVDVEPVRVHMMMLAEFGMGYKLVSKLAGVSVTTSRNILWGRQDPGPRYGELQKHIKRANAEKILAVKPEIDNLADGARICSRGTHRRVQALVAIGWSQSKLAERLGVGRSNFGLMMQSDQVNVRTHRATVALFDQLWDQLPPRAEWRDKIAYSRSLGYAGARRWLPPLAWDDIDNDVEPPVQDEPDGIDVIAVELAMHGEVVRLSPAERREAVTRLHAERWSDQRIAAALGCADRTVWRIRQELNLETFDFVELVKGSAA